MNKKIKKTKGFTLVEVIIYTAIYGLLMVSFVSLVLNLDFFMQRGDISQGYFYKLNTIEGLLSSKIRQASLISAPARGASSTEISLISGVNGKSLVIKEEDGKILIGGKTITDQGIQVRNLEFLNLGQREGRDVVSVFFEVKKESDVIFSEVNFVVTKRQFYGL